MATPVASLPVPEVVGTSHQWLQRSRYRPPLTDGWVHIIKKIGWISGIKIGRLGRVDG